MVVLAADDAGPAARSLLEATSLTDRPFARGAVALLLTASDPTASDPSAPGARTVDLDATAHHDSGPIGHLALLRWL